MSLARPDGGVLETDDSEGGDSEDGDELPTIHVGDHVTDRDDADEPPLVVTGLPLARVASYDVDGTPLTEYNPEYAAEDHVIEAAYVQRTDAFLDEQQTYAFPRSRLRLVTPLHDRDEGPEHEGDGDD